MPYSSMFTNFELVFVFVYIFGIQFFEKILIRTQRVLWLDNAKYQQKVQFRTVRLRTIPLFANIVHENRDPRNIKKSVNMTRSKWKLKIITYWWDRMKEGEKSSQIKITRLNFVQRLYNITLFSSGKIYNTISSEWICILFKHWKSDSRFFSLYKNAAGSVDTYSL